MVQTTILFWWRLKFNVNTNVSTFVLTFFLVIYARIVYYKDELRHGHVAQLVEQSSYTRPVPGSSPGVPTNYEEDVDNS